jgi:hypothetical protein
MLYDARMNFSRTEIPAMGLRSRAWDDDTLVDWVAGHRYPLQGAAERFNVGSAYRFDAARTASPVAVPGRRRGCVTANGCDAAPGAGNRRAPCHVPVGRPYQPIAMSRYCGLVWEM